MPHGPGEPAHHEQRAHEHEADDDEEPEIKRKRGPINRNRLPIISSQFRGIDASSVEKVGEYFKEKEFCVVTGDERYDKQTLEKFVI